MNKRPARLMIRNLFENLIRPRYLAHAARVVPAGTAELSWVTTIAVLAAPTATELNAGVDLTSFARNIPNVPETANNADIANLSSLFNARQPASFGGDDLSIDLYMDDATDTAYDTLIRSTAGFWVVALYGLATPGTFAIGCHRLGQQDEGSGSLPL